MAIRICIRDANRMGSQLLTHVLRRDRRFEVIDAFGGPEIANANIDVAVVSSNESDLTDLLEFVRELRALRPEVKVVALMDEPQRSTVLRAFRVGIRGIFCRRDSYKTLAKCIVSVHNGHVWADQTQVGYLLDAVGRPFPFSLMDSKGTVLLSPREDQVVQWVTEGLTNREIADRLNLSEHTIKNYLFRIFDKVGVSTRTELILCAVTQMSANGRVTSSSIPQPTCERRESCPITLFKLGERYRKGTEASSDQELAYMYLSLAEAVSEDIRNKSALAIQELARTIPTERLAKLRRRVTEKVRDVAKWESDETCGSGFRRAA